MLQILFVLFLAIVYMFARHFWRNRGIYLTLYNLFSGKPGVANQHQDVTEKRIITCPSCGSSPEVTHEPCSKCGRLL